LTTKVRGEHHVTIPMHDPLKIGTLSGIMGDVAEHHRMTKEDVMRLLFGGKGPGAMRETPAPYRAGKKRKTKARKRSKRRT